MTVGDRTREHGSDSKSAGFPHAILLDLDGTLVDSEGLAAEVLELYCRQNQAAPGREAEVARSVVGRTWLNGVLEAQRRGARFEGDLVALAAELNRFYRQRLEQTGVPEIPGAARAVKVLQPVARLAVVSGSQRAEVEWNLRALGILDCVEFYLGAEDVARGKPEPDPFLEAARRLGVAPETTLVFEDSTAGIHAARRAGVSRIVAIGHANRLGQDQSMADLRIPDWLQVDATWLAKVWQA